MFTPSPTFRWTTRNKTWNTPPRQRRRVKRRRPNTLPMTESYVASQSLSQLTTSPSMVSLTQVSTPALKQCVRFSGAFSRKPSGRRSTKLDDVPVRPDELQRAFDALRELPPTSMDSLFRVLSHCDGTLLRSAEIEIRLGDLAHQHIAGFRLVQSLLRIYKNKNRKAERALALQIGNPFLVVVVASDATPSHTLVLLPPTSASAQAALLRAQNTPVAVAPTTAKTPIVMPIVSTNKPLELAHTNSTSDSKLTDNSPPPSRDERWAILEVVLHNWTQPAVRSRVCKILGPHFRTVNFDVDLGYFDVDVLATNHLPVFRRVEEMVKTLRV
jgi:hypothetical protein